MGVRKEMQGCQVIQKDVRDDIIESRTADDKSIFTDVPGNSRWLRAVWRAVEMVSSVDQMRINGRKATSSDLW